MRELKEEFQIVYEHLQINRSHLERQQKNYLEMKQALAVLDGKLQEHAPW
jgi:hypothetical protein